MTLLRVLSLSSCCLLVSSGSVPVIEMRLWRTGDATLRDVVAQEISTAAKEFGFFVVRDHGIADAVVASADEAMRDFFSLPTEAKQEIVADKSRAVKTSRGYVGIREEQLDMSHVGQPDLKEVLDLGLPLGDSTETYLGPNPWPTAMPKLQRATEPYLKSALSLGEELLEAVARSVGLPDDAFSEVFAEPLVVQRLMHYPVREKINSTQPGELGCGAHYDFGGLTLLRQTDAHGLQVQPPSHHGVSIDGAPYSTMQGTFWSDLQNTHKDEWVSVKSDPDSIVVTFGEAMQRLTNGAVQATRHRVVHDGTTARHSMAVFVDPNPHKVVSPIPELAFGKARYPDRVAGHKTVLLAAATALQQYSKGAYLGFGKV